MPWPLAARRRCSARADAAAAADLLATAARIDRLTALGDAATAEKSLTLDIKVLRKSLERDRYGLVAQVLVARDGCTQFDCVGLPLADRSAAGRRQHGLPSLRHAGRALRADLECAGSGAIDCRPLPRLRGLPPSMPHGQADHVPSSRVPRRRRRSAS